MPSVWNFVGVDARTALTVYVFQVTTASGGTATGLFECADATDSETAAATARMPTRTMSVLVRGCTFFISPPVPTGSPRRRGRDRARRAVAASAASSADRCVEDEEADLVLGNVDRAFEADVCPLLRQLLRGRACPSFAGGAFCRVAASEVGLDEVARHALDATERRPQWKRQNV